MIAVPAWATSILIRHWGALAVGAVVIALGITATIQTKRLRAANTTLSQERAAWNDERMRQLAVVDLLQKQVDAMRATHRQETKEKEDEFETKQAALAATVTAAAADARSLRDRLAAATRAGGVATGSTGPATCQRDQDRLEQLGKLAGEGVELAVEGRGLLDGRELELKRVLDQLLIDRRACAGPVLPASGSRTP